MDADIKALMDKYRAPAILGYKPQVPDAEKLPGYDVPNVNSYLGGHPRLSGGLSWPRASDGLALHFLAQIDCAELPANGLLPNRGTLFFFARMDEEMLWDDFADPSDVCRVLYAAAPGSREIQPPADLPSLEYGYASRRHMEGAIPNHYKRWSLLFQPIMSWPDTGAIPGPWNVSYQQAIRTAREAERQAYEPGKYGYHQLLGNAPSTQSAMSVERDSVLLLQLNTDYTTGFMFCDCGEAEFWIKKEDLAARRFDKVFAMTCGG